MFARTKVFYTQNDHFIIPKAQKEEWLSCIPLSVTYMYLLFKLRYQSLSMFLLKI